MFYLSKNNRANSKRNSLSQKLIFISFFVLLIAIFFIPQISSANGIDLGLKYGEATGLSNTDPRIVIARIIQIILGFLGIIAVGLIIYGGFLWMTSQGDESRIEDAKNILKNTIIGLIIIISAFAIATFILNKISGAVGTGSGGGGGGVSGGGGVGVLGACSVESVYPESNQREVPRNTSIIVTFKEAIDAQTICGSDTCNGENILTDGSIRIYKTKDGRSNYLTNVLAYSTADKKTFVFMPTTFLGSPSEYLWYTVYLSNEIKKADGVPVFDSCRSPFLEWQFEVSNKIDLIPPQVKSKGVFPPPDDGRDTSAVSAEPENATGEIIVNNVTQPQIYSASKVTAIVAGEQSPTATAVADKNNTQAGALTVVVLEGGVTAQLSKGSVSLGTADFIDNEIIFPGILTLTVASPQKLGDFWDIDITGREIADTITIGRDIYSFTANKTLPTHILLGANANITASNIVSVINSRSDIGATANNNVVNIKAVAAGKAGNDIVLTSSNSTRLQTRPMSGGVSKQETTTINDKKDQPMNSVIQINFNEAVLPTTMIGNAVDVYNTIRVVNNNSLALPAEGDCASNADCLSFNCQADACVGNSLAGQFKISNGYKTVEFISDNQCGVNGCGEAIYCLPENSNLRVELVAASLISCNNSNDCVAKSPFTNCSNPGNSACQDSSGNNYPASDIGFGSGIMDTAINSLDGNRDTNANGPFSFFNENIGDTTAGDNFFWSFFINDKMETTPPRIELITPGQGGYSPLINPIEILFSKLMMASSLQTGSAVVDNGVSKVTHKALNIWSLGNIATGYWTEKDDLDTTLDGEADQTKALIKHNMLAEATSYKAQVGSFVKDIYQNCFKPSDGVGCSGVNANIPSCCSGTATANLSADGNCP